MGATLEAVTEQEKELVQSLRAAMCVWCVA